MINVCINIRLRTGEKVFKMRQVPRIGEKVSLDAILFEVEDVWYNFDPKLKFDVRIIAREAKI